MGVACKRWPWEGTQLPGSQLPGSGLWAWPHTSTRNLGFAWNLALGCHFPNLSHPVEASAVPAP